MQSSCPARGLQHPKQVGCRPPGGNIGDSRRLQRFAKTRPCGIWCGVPHAAARRSAAYLSDFAILLSCPAKPRPVVAESRCPPKSAKSRRLGRLVLEEPAKTDI